VPSARNSHSRHSVAHDRPPNYSATCPCNTAHAYINTTVDHPIATPCAHATRRALTSIIRSTTQLQRNVLMRRHSARLYQYYGRLPNCNASCPCNTAHSSVNNTVDHPITIRRTLPSILRSTTQLQRNVLMRRHSARLYQYYGRPPNCNASCPCNTAHSSVNNTVDHPITIRRTLTSNAVQYFRPCMVHHWLVAAVVGALGHVIRTGHALAITLTPAARRHCFAVALHERLCMTYTYDRSMCMHAVSGRSRSCSLTIVVLNF
jgi:hypothetical protein